MPEKIASHWNAQGQVDGYIPKFWGLFLMPFISVALFFFFILMPIIDPLKKNIEKFRKYFDLLIIFIFLFFFYIYILTILWNLGITFNMFLALIPAFGILFYFVGIVIEKAKRNWFVGIRTPWTLSNEAVWNKTHKIGGKLFKIAAIITFFGLILPKYAILLLILPVIAFSLYTIIYSYFEYQKQKKK